MSAAKDSVLEFVDLNIHINEQNKISDKCENYVIAGDYNISLVKK